MIYYLRFTPATARGQIISKRIVVFLLLLQMSTFLYYNIHNFRLCPLFRWLPSNKASDAGMVKAMPSTPLRLKSS